MGHRRQPAFMREKPLERRSAQMAPGSSRRNAPSSPK